MSADITALLLSRLQFAFTVSFHIIFPAFTIGLAAWLAVLEALHLATKAPVIAQAAAPESSLAFLFWGAGVIVLPPTMLNTAAVHFIFRGKVSTAEDY